MAFFEDGQWVEPLRKAMRSRSDTPLDAVARRNFGDMTQMDIGKGDGPVPAVAFHGGRAR